MALLNDKFKLRKYDSDIDQLTFVIDGWMTNGGKNKDNKSMAPVFVINRLEIIHKGHIRH